jgi:hypothetical protein
MGLAGGDADSEHCEQPVSASGVRGTRCVGRQNRVARDFSVSQLSQSFPLDDFARRTSENRALNKSLRRSCGDFERSKCSLFGFASDFFALGAELPRERAGSPLYVGMQTANAHAETQRRRGRAGEPSG